MQALTRAFLGLYLAHLLSDFPFQSAALAKGKKRGHFSSYLKHGLIHLVVAIAILWLFIPGSLISLRLYVAVLCLTLVHLAIDLGKMSFTDALPTFICDQVLHLLTVALTAAWLFQSAKPIGDFIAGLTAVRESRNSILLLLVIYVAVIFAGGYLIRFLTRSLRLSMQESTDEEREIRNAGLYIGWLERFLFLTAVLLKSPATVGLILTAKSIARYPELKSARFAEYFLIGTLLSMTIAILGGIVLLKVIYGTVILSK